MQNLTFPKPQHAPNYILGLDMGIASIGWACVAIDEEAPFGLLDCGVRVFDAAEHPKTGESLNATRREKRLLRRLIQRRAKRMKEGKRALVKYGVLKEAEFESRQNLALNLPINAWQLRVDGLDRKLERHEWGAVLLHLLKHRGYRSQRKGELNVDPKTSTKDAEKAGLLKGVADNHKLLADKAYRSCAELALNEFNGKLRNHAGTYDHTFNREDLRKELHTLFAKQRDFQNPHTQVDFEEKFDQLFWEQKEALAGNDLLKMLGYCTFEKDQHRAPKASYSAERFVMLTKLLNLRIYDKNGERALNQEEREILLAWAYDKSKLTYTQARKALGLSDTATFKGLLYKYKEFKEGEPKELNISEAEKKTLLEAKGFHEIRQKLEKAGLKDEWENLKANKDALNHIAKVFSLYKTDEDLEKNLDKNRGISEEARQVLITSDLSFSQFNNLSIQAIDKILVHMEQGERYDEACKKVYGDHYGLGLSCDLEQLFLPALTKEQKQQLTNPVVIRALCQARKVINAIVRKYGSPARVHIETGREIGKSYRDRRDIAKRQEENRQAREKAYADFKEKFPHLEPKGKDILKLRLYNQQGGKCLYSGKEIDINRLNEKGYVEIDHALPYSRTFDDSQSNKVLVFAVENQNKGNRTPYEWIGDDKDKWQHFVALVKMSQFDPYKKEKLLMTKLDEKGFSERNLNDTRYIAKFLKNWIAQSMRLTGKGDKTANDRDDARVFASNGQLTTFLRGRWGLTKKREDNDRHHALDAIVVACTTRSMQQLITNYAKRKELELCRDREELRGKYQGEYVDAITGEIKALHFPHPWDHFHKEVMIRVFSDDPIKKLADELPDRANILAEFITPLFVSRMPNRKVTGQGHEETIRSKKLLAEQKSTVRKRLTDLKLSDLEKMVNKDREPELYDSLKARLEAHGGDGKKAFKEPFCKKGGQEVKAITLETVQKSGIEVQGGVADNGSMARVDVFCKNKKFFLVPVYCWQVAKGILPMKACLQGKPEEEWEDISEAEFLFSLYKNDLVEVKNKKQTILGYFIGMSRSTATIGIRLHDFDKSKVLKGEYPSTGVKLVESFSKLEVDVLGKTISRCKEHEKRIGFRDQQAINDQECPDF